jgi:hypothetical protein
LGPGKFHLLVRMDSNASKSQRLFDARIRMAEANASMSAEEAKIAAIAFSSIDVSSQDGEGVLLNVLHAFGLQPKDPPRLSGQRGRLTIRVLCDWVEDSTLTKEH